MDIKCETCGNLYKPRNKNSKYCSRKCQYESYRKIKVDRVEMSCQLCDKKFYITENQKNTGKGKYCSRECKDNHQKEKYLGKDNPMYGKVVTEETRKIKSDAMKKMWMNDEYRISVKKGVKRFIDENGYYPGTDNESKEKRKKTMKERYGIEHNWNGKYGYRLCDKTTYEKYGEMGADMLIKYERVWGQETDIEILFKETLEELNIPYQFKYRIYTKNKKPFWFREFDFLINNTNILIEIDGDYWHGNEETQGDLNEFQIENRKKDKIKEDFASENGYRVFRFWGSKIKNSINEVKLNLLEIINNNEKD